MPLMITPLEILEIWVFLWRTLRALLKLQCKKRREPLRISRNAIFYAFVNQESDMKVKPVNNHNKK